jgi:hypothetical protein
MLGLAVVPCPDDVITAYATHVEGCVLLTPARLRDYLREAPSPSAAAEGAAGTDTGTNAGVGTDTSNGGVGSQTQRRRNKVAVVTTTKSTISMASLGDVDSEAAQAVLRYMLSDVGPNGVGLKDVRAEHEHEHGYAALIGVECVPLQSGEWAGAHRFQLVPSMCVCVFVVA